MVKNICECGKPAAGKGTGKLCAACRVARRAARAKRLEKQCAWCGKDVLVTGHKHLTQVQKVGNAYCSPECQRRWLSRASSERMRKTNLRRSKLLSKRMKLNNPMRDPRVREAVATKSRVRGWPSGVERGGNGRDIPIPQKLLSLALGWPVEVVVATGMRGKGGKLPTAYKLDIANEILKIGIEVDGNSHCNPTRRAQDRKKEKVLTGLGWKVLRFSNREVMEHLEACVQMVLCTISELGEPQPTE